MADNISKTLSKLSRSESNFRSLLDSACEGIFGVNLKGECIFINPACMNLLGYQHSDEITGKLMHPIIHHTCTDGTPYATSECPVYNTFRTGHPVHIDNEVFWRKNGQSFPVEYHASPIKQGDKITGSIVIFTDISQRRDAEIALEHSHEKLEDLVRTRTHRLNQIISELNEANEFNKSLLDTANALITVLNTDARIVLFNKKCEEITGYKAIDIIGEQVWKLIPKTEVTAVKKVFKSLTAGDFPSSYENCWLTKSGDERLISWSNNALLDENNKIKYIIATGIDITEKKEIENALQESQNLHKILAYNLPGIVYRSRLYDNNQTTFLNDMLGSITGYEPSELSLNKICSIFDLILDEDKQQVLTAIEHAITNQAPYVIEYRIHHKDGSVVYISDRGRPVYGDHDQSVYLDGVMFDITEKKQAQLSEHKRMLELAHISRLSTMGEMATELAHELNQPLSAISTYSHAISELLKSDTPDTANISSALNSISTQSTRAGEIIKGMRNFISKQESFPSTTQINDLVISAMNLSEIEARSNDVSININLTENLPHVLAEKILIEQVILNLVRNAIESMSAIPDDLRKLSIESGISPDNMIYVSIQDTGPGIHNILPEQVFDTFITTKESGMGMGLAISRRIIEAHGGNLTIANNSTHGVTFQFTLPIEDNNND